MSRIESGAVGNPSTQRVGTKSAVSSALTSETCNEAGINLLPVRPFHGAPASWHRPNPGVPPKTHLDVPKSDEGAAGTVAGPARTLRPRSGQSCRLPGIYGSEQ